MADLTPAEAALAKEMDELGDCVHGPEDPGDSWLAVCGDCDMPRLIAAVRPIIAAEVLRQAVADMSPITSIDDLYLRLKGARERLCQATSSELLRPGQVAALDRAVTEIDRVGAYLPRWSRHDLPTLPDLTDGGTDG